MKVHRNLSLFGGRLQGARHAALVEMERELRTYFRREGIFDEDASFLLLWIKACAAVPSLRWPLTVTIGKRLAAVERRPAPNDESYLVIGRISWFRDGEIPFDVRQTLIESLEASDLAKVRAVINGTLCELLVGQVSIATRTKGRFGSGWGSSQPTVVGTLRTLLEIAPKDSVLRDPLLVNVSYGRRLSALNIGVERLNSSLPSEWRWLLDTRSLLVISLSVSSSVALSMTL